VIGNKGSNPRARRVTGDSKTTKPRTSPPAAPEPKPKRTSGEIEAGILVEVVVEDALVGAAAPALL